MLPRQTVRVLNTYAMQPATTVIPPAVANRAVTGVHADYLVRTPVLAEQDSRVQLERNRLNVAQGPSLAASLRRPLARRAAQIRKLEPHLSSVPALERPSG